MFRMVKNNIEFEVSMNGSKVHIVVLQNHTKFDHLWQTIAVTEATVAQLHLDSNNTSDPIVHLISYFENKGWVMIQ